MPDDWMHCPECGWSGDIDELVIGPGDKFASRCPECGSVEVYEDSDD